MIVTKKEQLKDHIAKGNIKKALNIAKTFRREFNKVEQRHLQIANETINDKSRRAFYKSLGIDWKNSLSISTIILKNY